jgi:hypothetical protein
MWLPETAVLIAWPDVWLSGWWQQLTWVRVAAGTAWVYYGCTLAVATLALSSVFFR